MLGRLTRRGDFLHAQAGRSVATGSFVLKARARVDDDDPSLKGVARFGFTVTRRLGNAVVRNRARRRLKEAVRKVAADDAQAGFDYVLIGRPGAVTTAFGTLLEELQAALRRIHQPPGRRRASR